MSMLTKKCKGVSSGLAEKGRTKKLGTSQMQQIYEAEQGEFIQQLCKAGKYYYPCVKKEAGCLAKTASQVHGRARPELRPPISHFIFLAATLYQLMQREAGIQLVSRG